MKPVRGGPKPPRGRGAPLMVARGSVKETSGLARWIGALEPGQMSLAFDSSIINL